MAFWSFNLFFDAACGGNIVARTHGVISSPGYPGNYPHNRDCVWTVSGSPGQKIGLSFGQLALERHPNCSYDYLEVVTTANYKFSSHSINLTDELKSTPFFQNLQSALADLWYLCYLF